MKLRLRSIYIIMMALVAASLLLPGCGSSKSSSKKSDKDRYEIKRSDKPLRRLDPSQSVDGKVGRNIVGEARRWLGTPYVYGGKTRRKGTDCSGMIMVIFEEVAKVKIPRNSAKQQEYCMTIDRRLLEPGDLVFFASSRGGSRVSHVGIYIGDNNIIHASSSRGVIVSSLSEKYFATHFHSAGRVQGITYAATGRKIKKHDQKAPDDREFATVREPQKQSSPEEIKKVDPVAAITLDEFAAASTPARTEAPDSVSLDELTKLLDKNVSQPADSINNPVKQFCDSTATSGDSIRSEVKRAMQKLF